MSSDKERMELIILLSVWGTYVGIEINADELSLLANFIQENYGQLNLVDIKECSRLCTTGVIGGDNKPYGKFSPLYVSAMLNSYIEHRREVIYKVKTALDKIKEVEVIIPSDKERLDTFKQLLTLSKADVSKGLFCTDSGDVLFDFIRKNKLIKVDDDLRKEALDYGEKSFRTGVKSKAYASVIMNRGFDKKTDDEKESIIRGHARNYVVNRCLVSLNLDNLLKILTIEMIR